MKVTQRRIKNNTETTQLWKGEGAVKAESVNADLLLLIGKVQR